ncbi:MAG: proteasome assembly chaperone family protein [Microthrixaceae bacterium]
MSDDLVERTWFPELDRPVLLVALEGWIDAGMGATNAMSALLTGADAETVATFDADRLLDHRARRPIMHLVNGLITGLSWPGIELRAGTDAAGQDVLLLVGAEPDFEWRAFCDAVVDLAQDFDCRMMVALGAYPAPVPHTRDTNLAITTSSADLSDRLNGYVRGTLDVPGGIQAVLDLAFNEAGIPAAGLWAQVPHYVSSMPYPAASVALLEGLRELAGVEAHQGDLPVEARATRSRLDDLVAENPQHQAMVTQLEEFVDQGLADQVADAPTIGFDRIPSGDELAAELQEFLQHRGEDD